MLFKNKKTIVAALVIFSLGISGCSYKVFRNKPSIFVHTQNKLSEKQNANIKQDGGIFDNTYCMDSYEDINDLNKTKYGLCDEYYTVDISNVLKDSDENNSTKKRKIIDYLLLYSDDNCRRYSDKFYYNEFLGKSGLNVLNLNVAGFGINIGSLKEFTASELRTMSENLTSNSKYRSKLKKDIYESLEKDCNTIPVLLNKVRAYDHACGLLIKEETLFGDSNGTH